MLSFVVLAAVLLAWWLWGPLQSMPHRWRLAAMALTAAAGAFPVGWLKLAQSGALPYALIAYLQVPGGWMLAMLPMLAAFVALRDGLWLLLRLAGRPARRLHAGGPTLVAVALAAGLSAWGVRNGLRPPEVHERTLELARLPPALDGLRVAVLADIHASPVNDAAYVQTVVERTLAARPDLIVLPGDLVDGDVASGRAHVAPLARLAAPYGVWAAPGNHEYYSGYDAWMAELRRLGLNLLENRMQLLEIRGARLALSGIGDPAYGRTSPHNADPARPEGVPPDAAAVARAARAAAAQFHLLLAHQPKFARDNAALGVDLQLSGHTHGGHILGMDRWLVAPVNNGFVRGRYDVDGMQLLVSSGAGLWAGFAVRLGVAPGIDLLTLRRAPAALQSPALIKP